ncbi:bifunctional lysine-specific demethylase and histidyl-hydroxylase NO66-like, partial [Branchiostoma floridae]
MKPSHVQLKRQKRRENRRKSREKKRLWNLRTESLALEKPTDTSSKSFKEETELVQETTQTFVSGNKNKREAMDQNRKKKEMNLKQPSPSNTSKTIKSPPKAKRLKDKGKHLAEKPTNNDSTTGQDSKQKNGSEKRPLSQGKEKPTLAKRLKTKKLDEKDRVSTVSGSGLTARFDFSSPQKLFESIISPVTYEQFFAEYWEKKPLIAKRNDAAVSEAYKALFSRDVLKKLLKKHDIEYIRDVNVC